MQRLERETDRGIEQTDFLRLHIGEENSFIFLEQIQLRAYFYFQIKTIHISPRKSIKSKWVLTAAHVLAAHWWLFGRE